MTDEDLKDAVIALTKHHTKEQREQSQRELIELNARNFDKAAAYSNLILLAGYAGAFAIWGNTKNDISRADNIWIAGTLGISIIAFIAHEVYQMAVRGTQFVAMSEFLFSDNEPDAFFARLAELRRKEHAQTVRSVKGWTIQFAIALATAIIAAAILFWDYFAILLR